MEWKDVVGYEGIYEVSDIGTVKSVKRAGTKGGILKGTVRGHYESVILYKNGKAKTSVVHRLVAEAFIPNKRKERIFVNHKDGNKLNNNVKNLEWCTQSENQLHAYRTGLQKPNVKEAHKVRHEQTKVMIRQFDLEGNYIRTFDSIKDAATSIGMKDGTHISAVARGRRITCGGYKWKY